MFRIQWVTIDILGSIYLRRSFHWTVSMLYIFPFLWFQRRCHHCAPTRTNVAALPGLRLGRLRLGPGDVRAVGRRWSAFQTQQGRHSLRQSRSSGFWLKKCLYFSVLRINEILVRIRSRWSVPLTNGSGFGSCYFRQWPSWCQQKIFFLLSFLLIRYFLNVHLHHFSKIKVIKKSQNSRNQCFSYYFCLMIERSGSLTYVFGPSGSGSISQKSGFETGRPKKWYVFVRIFQFSFFF